MAAGENATLKRRPLTALLRCLRLLCPACGQSSIVQRPFKIKDQCPFCRSHFKREDGFFVGAISINVVTTEVVILALYLISMPFIGAYYQAVLSTLFAVAVLFPLAFYHHSWSLWLSLDHLVETLPKETQGRTTTGRRKEGGAGG
ncbi:MAG TPA: hypothetical protein VF553_11130 [Pyrinomonadaceae bacterium]|jgi:uncharacterized protein (DUF983 family)